MILHGLSSMLPEKGNHILTAVLKFPDQQKRWIHENRLTYFM